MFFAEFDELFNTLGCDVCLNNMGRSYHISTTLAEDFNTFFNVGFQLFVGAVRHQILLVDSSPECELITEVVFNLLWRVFGNTWLNRVENIEATLLDHRHQRTYCSIAVQNHDQIRFLGFQGVDHLFVIWQQQFAEHFGGKQGIGL